MFEIVKPAPAPSSPCRERQQGRPPKYPFGDMDVGDWFEAGPADRAGVQRAASMYGLRNGKLFTTRLQPDGGVKVWRAA